MQLVHDLLEDRALQDFLEDPDRWRPNLCAGPGFLAVLSVGGWRGPDGARTGAAYELRCPGRRREWFPAGAIPMPGKGAAKVGLATQPRDVFGKWFIQPGDNPSLLGWNWSILQSAAHSAVPGSEGAGRNCRRRTDDAAQQQSGHHLGRADDGREQDGKAEHRVRGGGPSAGAKASMSFSGLMARAPVLVQDDYGRDREEWRE
jgi:hypothetical protein